MAELPEAEARDKIDAAVELARQESAVDEPTQPHPIVVVQDDGGDDRMGDQGPVPDPSPTVPWTSAAAMRADMKARGISTVLATREAHAIAKAHGVDPPTGSLDSFFKHPDAGFVAAFAAWVANHDELEGET